MKAIFLFFILIKSLISGEILEPVRYWLSEKKDFSRVSKIEISEGKILKIQDAQKTDSKVRYILPSFCDASASITSGNSGGEASNAEIDLALKSFLHHGFTHILSVEDLPKILEVQKKISSGKTNGPVIRNSGRIIISSTKEYPGLPNTVYFSSTSEKEILEEVRSQSIRSYPFIQVYHRFYGLEDYSLNSGLIRQIKKIAEEREKKIFFTTFVDRLSILESLRAGARYIKHPIPPSIGSDFEYSFQKEIKWMPSFSSYYFLKAIKMNEGCREVSDLFKDNSSFFKFHEFVKFVSECSAMEVEKLELEQASDEFNSYLGFLQSYPNLAKNMILGSSSGQKLTFPGVSGILELILIQDSVKDISTFVSIATENTCPSISETYDGKIKEGNEANLIIYNENPVKDNLQLFKPEKVYLKGKIVVPESKPKEEKRKKR
jgi:hypothetical protein